MFYGLRAGKIGEFRVPGGPCAHCQHDGIQHVSVYGRYLHALFIPIFPVGKKAVSECTNCKKTIPKKEFSSILKQNYEKKLSS